MTPPPLKASRVNSKLQKLGGRKEKDLQPLSWFVIVFIADFASSGEKTTRGRAVYFSGHRQRDCIRNFAVHKGVSAHLIALQKYYVDSFAALLLGSSIARQARQVQKLFAQRAKPIDSVIKTHCFP